MFLPTLVEEPKPIDISSMRSNSVDCINEIRLVTFHYNPCRFRRLRETYYEWLPTLGPIAESLLCYELVFDDDEPEIEGSIVIRGTRAANSLWQKEAIVNLALAHCAPTIKYFGWVDHDIVFENPNWLADAVRLIDYGADAVQLFSEIARMSLDRVVENAIPGAVAGMTQGKPRFANPGGAWLARRSFMDSIGGLNVENIFGGGDQAFLDGLLGIPGNHLKGYSEGLRQSLLDWIKRTAEITGGAKPRYVDGTGYHLWHGTHKDRQYATRNRLLIDEAFDPRTDIRLNPVGLLEWCSDKPRLHDGLRQFFENRREDG